jgi:hypothetical protein
MGDATGLALAAAINQSTSLQVFKLECRETAMSDVIGISLGKALQATSSLRVLHLECPARMGDATGLAVVDVIKSNASLREFKLECSESDMGDATILALAAAIKGHTSLQVFALSSSAVTEETCVALGEALQASASLRDFHLSCDESSHDLGDSGGLAFARAVKCNHTLRSIAIYGGRSWSEGTDVALEEAFTANLTLIKAAGVFEKDDCLIVYDALMSRNRQLRVEWQHLQLVARKCTTPAFVQVVQNAIMDFFAPPCVVHRPWLAVHKERVPSLKASLLTLRA